MSPGQGWKFRYGILGVDPALDGVPAQPAPVALEADRLAGGHPDLLLHQVEAGDHLGHGMLDLDPGVHLHEVERAVGVEQELERAGADVADVGGQRDGRLAHPVAQVRRERRARALLDQLLVAPLHRAVALAQVDHLAGAVAHDLDLDVPRAAGQVLLDVHRAVAERRQRLVLGQPEELR